MSFVNSIVKELDNEFAYIASDEEPNETFIDTGSYVLNGLLSGNLFGGMPGNSITGIAGEFQTGKTYFSLSIARNFLTKIKKAEVIFFDSEKNPILNGPALRARGIDASRFAVFPVATIQEFRTQVSKVCTAYTALEEKARMPLLFILDSLGNLSTTKEIEDIKTGNDKRDMTRAQAIRGTFRALTLELGKLNIPMIVTNHTYQVIGSYFPETDMGGGEGLKYAASTIIFLSSAKERNSEKDVIGAVITVQNKKSRYIKPFNKVSTLLNYETGVDKYYGLPDLLVEAGLWKDVKKVGWVTEGNERVSFKNFANDPDTWITPERLAKVNEYLAKKFKYGTDVPKEPTEAEAIAADPTLQALQKQAVKAVKDVLDVSKEVSTELKKKRGRPKKEDSAKAATPKKRGRGRPRKDGN